MDTEIADAIVVGAGIGGLSAAHTLRKAGRKVVVLEATDRVAGRIVRMTRNGDSLEIGAQGLHTNYTGMFGLVEEMGLSADLLPADGPMVALDRDGRPHEVHGNGDLLRLLDLRGKLDLLRYATQHYLLRKRIPQYEIVRDIPAYDNITAAEALSWAGRDFYDFILRPQAHAQCGADPEHVNLYHVVNMLMLQLTTRAVGLRTGIATLCERLADTLDVRLGTEVTGLLTNGGRVEGVHLAGGRTMRARHVIVACPINAAARIVPEEFGPAHAFLSQVPATPLPLVALFLDRPLPSQAYAFFGHAYQPKAIFNMALDHLRKTPYMVPSGKSVVTAWPAHPGGAEMIRLSDDEIVRKALADVAPMFPGIAGMVEEARVQRHTWGFARHEPGAHRKILDFKAYASTLQGVSFAGNDYDGIHMESSVQSAFRAAARALAG